MPYIRRIIRSSCSLITLGVLFGLLLAAPVAASGGGELLWQRNLPVPGKQEAVAAAVDGAGNLIVTGYQAKGGTDDVFQTVKFLADGSGPAWGAPQVYDHGTGSDRAAAVAVDGSNNIIVAGTVWNGSNYDLRTIKYSPAGAELWGHTYATTGNDQAVAVAVAADGAIFVGGYQTNTATGMDDIVILKYPAGGGTPQTIIYNDPTYGNHDRLTDLAVNGSVLAVAGTSSKGGSDFDLLALKYDLNGTLLWAKRQSSPGTFEDRAVAVKVNASGDLFVAGYLSHATHKDLYLAKYTDAAPDHLAWAEVHDGGFDEEARALTLDPLGNPVVAGYSWTLDGKFDLYVAKYLAATGEAVWRTSHNSGGDATDLARAVTCDADGNVYVTGRFEVAGNKDFQTLKLAAQTGNLIWQAMHNGVGNRSDEPVGIFLGAAGSVLVAGWSDVGVGAVDPDFQVVSYALGAINRPTGLTAQAVSDTAIKLTWVDNAPNEERFVIERKLGDGGSWQPVSTTPAILPADTVSYTDNGLSAGNYYFYRVRSYSEAGGYSGDSNVAKALSRVIAYAVPAWSYIYGSPASRNDEAVAIAVGPDDHPVVTGYSDLDEEGLEGQLHVNSYDFLTFKLNRDTKAELWSPGARHDSGSGGTDMAASLVVDRNNDVIVAGNSYLAVTDGDMDSMFTIKYPAAGPPPLASDQVNGPLEQAAYARTIATAVDSSNNVAVAGYFKRTPTNDDIQVVKYNAALGRAWPLPGVVMFDGGGNDQPSAVALDASGNVFVTGYTFNVGAGNYDFYTAKYDGATGALLWSDTYNGPDNGDDQAVGIAVDAAGNAYVTGFVSASDLTLDYLTIKYDGAAASSKRRIWEARYSGPGGGNDEPAGIGIDAIDGAVVVAGTSITAPGDGDLHLLRYRGSDGAIVWQRTVEQPASDDRVAAVAVDSSGYINLAGTTGTGAAANAVALSYDFEGNFLAATRYSGTGEDRARAIAVNYRGEAFVAGSTRQPTLDNDFLVFKQTGSVILVPAPFVATPHADAGKLNLSWRQNTPGTSFRLERTLAPVTVASVWTTVNEPTSGTLSYQDSNLTANTGYCYRISAFSGSIDSRKIIACAVTTFGAPVLLPLSPDSTSQITVSWQEVVGGSGYGVERSPTGQAGSWTTVATPTAGETSFIDRNLAAGTRYYYRVSVKSESGAYSLPSAVLDTYTKPAAPVLDPLTNITKNQVGLSWPAVTGASNYTVAYRTDSGTFADFPACTNITATACTVTGLPENTRFHFQVTASNAVSGVSSPSTAAATYTLLAEPTLATATPGSGAITIGWTNNSASLTGYYVEEASCDTNLYRPEVCLSNPYAWNPWTQVGGPLPDGQTTLARSNLTGGFHYKHRIRAYSATTGVYSLYSNETLTAPHLVANSVSAVEPSSVTSLTITWSDVTGETSYSVERKQGAAGNWAVVPAAANLAYNVLSFNDTGLQQQTEYCYRVMATNSLTGNTVYSSNAPCRMTPLPAPTATVTVTGAATTTIAWSPVAGSTGYDIERSVDMYPNSAPTGYWMEWTSITPTLPASTLNFNDSGLQAGYTYRYRVRDTFGVGDYSAWTEAIVVTTIPRAPAVTAATAVATDQINVSWEDVYGETGYLLEWKGRVGTDCTAGTWSAPMAAGGRNSPASSHSGLTAGAWYCYRVTAVGAAGQSLPGTSLAQATLLPAPVLAPLSAISAASITLNWGDVPTNAGYVVERSSDGVNFSPRPGPQLSTTYTDAGLEAGTLYYYRVSALNGAGIASVPSTVRSATTTPAAPPLTATVLSASEVNLRWPVVKGATEYRIYQDGNPTPTVTVAKGYALDYCGNSYPTVLCTAMTTPIQLKQLLTGLTANTGYCFQLRAWNSTGNESVTSEQCLQTTNLANPLLTATPVNSFRVRLDWSNGSCTPVACATPDSYDLERETIPGKWRTVATLPAGTSSFVDGTGVEPSWSAPDGKVHSSRYKYRLRSLKAGVASPYTEANVTMPLFTTGDGTCP